jgi:hypothetical protein
MKLGEWDRVRKGAGGKDWSHGSAILTFALPRFQGKPDDASSPEKDTSLSFIRRIINISSIHHETPASFTPEVPGHSPFPARST